MPATVPLPHRRGLSRGLACRRHQYCCYGAEVPAYCTPYKTSESGVSTWQVLGPANKVVGSELACNCAIAPLAHARASTSMFASDIWLLPRRAIPLLPRITSMQISNGGSRSAAKLVQRSETLAWQRLSTCESNTGGASMATCATSTSGTSVHISHCQLFYSLRVPLSKGTGRIQLEGVTECRMHVLPRSPCCSPVAPVAPSAP